LPEDAGSDAIGEWADGFSRAEAPTMKTSGGGTTRNFDVANVKPVMA
jgi:hypothetical protein